MRRALPAVLALALSVLPAPGIAQRQPVPGPRTVRRFQTTAELVAALDGNVRRLPAVLQSAEVVSSLRRICAVSSPERVTCSTVDQIARFLKLQPVDEKLMRLGLNDLMSSLGLPGTDQTLFMCMGQGPVISPSQFGSTGGGGLSAPTALTPGSRRPPASFPGAQSFSTATQAPGMAERTSMSQRCGASARSSGMFGAASATDRNYQQAVNSAVAVMNRAMGQCRESGMSPVADDPAGTTTTTPASGQKPKAEKPANSGNQAMDNVMTWFGAWAGATELVVAVAEGNIPGAILSVAGIAADVDGIAADGTATGETNDALQAAGKTSTVVSLVVTVVTEGAAGVAAGTAIAAVGAAAGTLAVVVPATRWADEKTGFGDAVVNWAVSRNEGSPEYRKQYGIRDGPAPGSTDRLTCAQMQQAWERFRDYCSQPGNNWRTYDCAKFVARMNGCADPGVVNPGPDGDYVCRARTSQRDKAIKACEMQRRKTDMIAHRVGDIERPGCAASVDELGSARANAAAIFRERQCTKANPGDDGAICPGAAPAGGGGGTGGVAPPKPTRRIGTGS